MRVGPLSDRVHARQQKAMDSQSKARCSGPPSELRQFLERFQPAILTPENVPGQKWNPRIVRQRQVSKHQLLARSIIIPVRIVIVLSESQMSVSRFRA